MISNGKTYLFVERVPLRTHQILRRELTRGKKVFYISKNAPHLLKTQLSFDDKKLIVRWLNPRPRSDCIPPMNLKIFEKHVESFIAENRSGIVVLNGLEILQMWNGFIPVIKTLKKLQGKMNQHGISMMISLDPKTQFENHLIMLQRISDEVVSSNA